MDQSQWVEFFFDGNEFMGVVYSPEKWRQLVQKYHGQMTVQELLERALSYRPEGAPRVFPSFGFGVEFRGEPSLGKWAAENGMDLVSVANQNEETTDKGVR